MKSKSILFYIFAPAVFVVVLSGCAFHDGAFNSGVAITNNQFRVVGIAEGRASTTHILGFGGLAKDALVQEAKRDLYSKYPLGKGMVLANVTVDFKRAYFFVAAHTLVTVSADVIDFNPVNLNLPYKGFYTEDSTFFPMGTFPLTTNAKSMLIDSEANYIKAGSKVAFRINNVEMKGTVLEINNFGIKCSYETESGMKKIYLKSNNLTVIQF